MPHERQNSLRADVIAPPPDAMTEAMVTEVVVVLADVLRLKPEKIDPQQTFRSLGLDSLLTVEFVATVNARYGTAVRAAALLDHPTPLAFTRHVAGELGTGGSATGTVPPSGARGPAAAQDRGPAPAMPGTAAPMPVVPVPETGSGPVQPSGGPPATASSTPGAREILDHLREELARILCCDPWDIDPTAAFNLLGVDSIIGAQFMAVINGTYGMEERPVALYEHPSIAAMAAHIALATTGTATAAPTTGAMPAPVAEPVAEAEDPGLRALLDAVRDDRLSVDEALTLLPRRA
ncbi:phosphopantetheine-binding protein [Streptomyces sp. NPDC087218]|uniref:phosphopantetheine-binding protein n=1 Tax=Streptomyces sp. NPDC087218 TaxID=3365769 RepID=UPI0037F22363